MTESGYRRLAETLEGVSAEKGKLAKVERLAGMLRELDGARLAIAARLLSGSPFAEWEQQVTSAGWATLARAASEVTGWDLETIGACAGAIGDLGEAISLLLPERSGDGLTILEADETLRRLAQTRKAAEKRAILEELLRRCSPVEAKYLLKTLSGGMRIGADATTVEEAIARAFGADREEVARARRDCGDIGETAVAARQERLESLTFRLFHPIGFMLATPIEDAGEVAAELAEFAIEDKFDGIRAHAHKSGSRVALFSRTLDDITLQFPEITLALALAPDEFLLDGEIVAWKDSRPDSFFRLQRRLGRKAPPPDLLAEIPVAFVAYDCLAAGGEPLFEAPWRERRRRLEAIAADGRMILSKTFTASNPEELEALFQKARARGNEGLMLKRVDSTYQAGKRGKAWRKWKKALATLDVVVTAVEQGHGKRAGMLSDYTFAVRDGDRFVNIGKAYSGLTDEEIRSMGAHFRRITTARYGPVRAVTPEVVIEVAFDTIQKSSRHKSGFALRFPRIVRLRPDKTPSDATTLDEVRHLYETILGAHSPEHRESSDS
ncbi:MAG TPA: ATP-dependent DNA ligase, partial [Thermoanaerobaculia bacterium]|nr:ATP-dependent DNA ligase [Thermoanaerobaculia bacterium]